MGDLISINGELSRLIAALRAAVVGYEQSVKDSADKRSTYDVEWAKAYLSQGEGTQKQRESEAVLIVERFMRDARIAEATRDAYKERLRAIEAVITIQQPTKTSRRNHAERILMKPRKLNHG